MQAYDEYRGLMDDLSKADQFTYQVCVNKDTLLIECTIRIFCVSNGIAYCIQLSIFNYRDRESENEI